MSSVLTNGPNEEESNEDPNVQCTRNSRNSGIEVPGIQISTAVRCLSYHITGTGKKHILMQPDNISVASHYNHLLSGIEVEIFVGMT